MVQKSLRPFCVLLLVSSFFAAAAAQSIHLGQNLPVLPSFGTNNPQLLWPKVGNQFQIPYVIATGSADTTNLNAAITQFNNTFSNIKFVARTTQTDFVSFFFDPTQPGGQGEATVGRQGGMQQVGGQANCTVATILHEMGHVVGLLHEQSRPDRNNFVSVNFSNFIKGSIANFNPILDQAQTFGTSYDYASIMQYPAFSFSRNGGPAIEANPAGIPLSNQTGYTAADIDGIERLYGTPPTKVTVTSNPPGLQVIVDGVTITTPQVFTWTLNSTHTLDIPSGVQTQTGDIVNSTTSTTFYYNFGRWSDAAAASHTITVLPGNGEPATPATSPAITTYTADFVQLVPYSASIFPTNTGTVVPSPAPQSFTGSALSFYTARQQVTLTATPNAGQNFYEFNNAPFFLPGGLGSNPKTFYVPDTGLTIDTTVEFSPDPVYTIAVNPDPFSSNLSVSPDGGFAFAPKNFSLFYDSTWTSGSMHSIAVNSLSFPWSINTRYRFSSWSDGTNTTTDNITLPATSMTYTANLTPEYFVTDMVNEGCAASIGLSPASPTSDGYYPSGDNVTFTETPNTGWLFTGWQFDLSGTSPSEALAVTDEVLVAADYNTTATPLTLTSLSPAAAVAGGPGFTLTLNGTGFSATSLVSVGGTFLTPKFISPTQLSVVVTAAQIAKIGPLQVFVEDFPSGAACAAFGFRSFNVANAPIVKPSAQSITYTPQLVGTTSAAKTVTLTNTSSVSVNLNSIAVAGDFAISANTCGSSLAAKGTCSVSITMTPAVSGAINGSLAISDTAPDSPQTVALSGTGNLPLTVTPATLTYAAESVGSTSASQTISITNNEASAVNLSVAASADYAIATTGTTCTSSLASLAKCTLAVTFSPATAGAINGSVSITNGTAFSPQVVSLNGTGTGGTAAPLTFTPASFTFANQVVGTTSAGKTITVKNASAGAVTLSALAATGDFAVAGSGTTPCAANLMLNAGASCTLTASFSPPLGANGTINGAIVVNDNANVSQQVFDLKGPAVQPLSFSPGTLTFAAQTVATASAAQTVTITNNLATALTPTITGSGDFAIAPGTVTPCAGTLAAHAKCTFTVTFTPSAVGTRSSVVTVTDSANPGIQTQVVTGTGQ